MPIDMRRPSTSVNFDLRILPPIGRQSPTTPRSENPGGGHAEPGGNPPCSPNEAVFLSMLQVNTLL